MRLYKKTVKIKGLGNFDKICNVNTRGIFTITYPRKIITTNLIETETVRSSILPEAEKLYTEAIAEFESLSFSYKMVILYTMEERSSSGDGTGDGFVFQWGVFREIEGKDWGKKFFFERGSGTKEINTYYNKVDKWNKINWSESREEFFMKITLAIRQLYTNLNSFIDFSSMEDSNIDEKIKNNNIKLLT